MSRFTVPQKLFPTSSPATFTCPSSSKIKISFCFSLDMVRYPSNPGYLWDFPLKKNNSTKPPCPIYDIPSSPVPACVDWDSGEKVEALETIEVAVQKQLRKKHTYLQRVQGNYRLRKIIFHTQVIRNWNVKKGYPEDRDLAPRLTRSSKFRYPPPSRAQPLVLPAPVPVAVDPPVVPPCYSSPQKLPLKLSQSLPLSPQVPCQPCKP